ncbi:MAG: amidohydrolase family protein, partial [Candidatus Zixiibacteriota bacterium]
DRLLESIDEFIQILSKAKLPGEIYHLKAAGNPNWTKADEAIAKIDSARNAGVQITADMYTYIASASGLDATMPPWVQEGGYKDWAERLKDPAIRERVKNEMNSPSGDWENCYLYAGPEGILLLGFKSDSLRPYTGKTLAEVARMRGESPEETAMNLVIEDGSRVGAAFFEMNEDNVQKQIKLPWMSFCSDEGSYAPEGVFLTWNPHPRAYGSFARLLGKYVRDEKLITLEEAIRRLTSFPAENLKIKRRGLLKPGYFADVVVFDPTTIQDHATFEQPHQYSTGVSHVFVNGVQVLNNGEHTGEKPGRVLRGPGWKGCKQ